MTTTLITGANKGLGRETARALIAQGHRVLVGARDAERGTTAARELGAEFIQLDVTSDDSVTAAAARVAELGGLDVLVNNAGVEERQPDGGFIALPDLDAATAARTFETNVLGLIRTTRAFLPLLERSAAGVIVNVGSALGSLELATEVGSPVAQYPGIAYPASKAAVTMITVRLAAAYPRLRINVVDPGYTDTDLNHHQGVQTVEEGAEIIVRMATVTAGGPTGTYTSLNGAVPW